MLGGREIERVVEGRGVESCREESREQGEGRNGGKGSRKLVI